MSQGCAKLLDLIGVPTQLAVLVTCAGVLLLKKLREDTGRSWLDFSLDASKQLIGAVWAYLVGLLLGLLPGAPAGADLACAWYWSSVMVDTTLGVYVEYLLMNLASSLLEGFTGHEGDFRSGEYRSPSELAPFAPERYSKQLLVWLACIAGAKLLLWPLMLLFLEADIMAVADALTATLDWSPLLQLAVMTVVTPCGMYVLQVWMTDGFLQKGGLPLLDMHDEHGSGLGEPLLDEEAHPGFATESAAGVGSLDVDDVPPLPPQPWSSEGENKVYVSEGFREAAKGGPFQPLGAVSALQAQAADLETLIQARDAELGQVRERLERVHDSEKRLCAEVKALGGTIPEGVTQELKLVQGSLYKSSVRQQEQEQEQEQEQAERRSGRPPAKAEEEKKDLAARLRTMTIASLDRVREAVESTGR